MSGKIKKILLLIILIIVSILFFTIISNFKNSNVDTSNEKTYVLTDNTYLIGEDLPKKSYTVVSIDKNIEVFTLEGMNQEDLTLKAGDSIDLTNKDVISVNGGTLTLV